MKTIKITLKKHIGRKTHALGEDHKEIFLEDSQVRNLSNHIHSVHEEELFVDSIEEAISQVLSSVSVISFNIDSVAWGMI